MKSVFYIIIFLVFGVARAQTVYLDSTMTQTEQGNHAYYRVLSKNGASTIARTYYKSGVLFREGKSITPEPVSYVGIVTDYWENGQPKAQHQFDKGVAAGGIQTWYENGKPHLLGYIKKITPPKETGKPAYDEFRISQYWDEGGVQTIINGNGHYDSREKGLSERGEIRKELRVGKWSGTDHAHGLVFEETYDAQGKLISGNSHDGAGNTFEYTLIGENAIFPGEDDNAFLNFIRGRYRTPQNSKSGTIIASFAIDPSGLLTEATIVEGLDRKADMELLRVLKKSPRWQPATIRGKAVPGAQSVRFTVTSLH